MKTNDYLSGGLMILRVWLLTTGCIFNVLIGLVFVGYQTTITTPGWYFYFIRWLGFTIHFVN